MIFKEQIIWTIKGKGVDGTDCKVIAPLYQGHFEDGSKVGRDIEYTKIRDMFLKNAEKSGMFDAEVEK